MQQNKKNVILKDYKKLYRLYQAGTVFTALDTETSAISPNLGRVIEIGAVKFTKDGIISTYKQLINPKTILSPFISNLTHITQEMVDTAPVMEDCIATFLEFISNSIIIAHNARFDMNFINAECTHCNYPVTRNHCVDTLQYAKFLYPEMERHKLDYLADYFELNKGNSHRAYDDAECCRELFIKMIEDTKYIYGN